METHVPIESVTPGQAGKLYDMFVASLCKSGVQRELSQQVIEHQGTQVVRDMVAVFCKYVEAISNMFSRHVTVNRTRTPIEAINATGRNKYVNDDVVATMPQGEGGEEDVFFFKPDKSAYDKDGIISDDEVARQYELRGLKPADPYLLAAANEADQVFADDHPNGTHWKDANGNWCYAAFRGWYDDFRYVNVYRTSYDVVRRLAFRRCPQVVLGTRSLGSLWNLGTLSSGPHSGECGPVLYLVSCTW